VKAIALLLAIACGAPPPPDSDTIKKAHNDTLRPINKLCKDWEGPFYVWVVDTEREYWICTGF
jgi:hypothetical protein